LIEQRGLGEAAKLDALRDAARPGFDDLDHGRHRDLDDSALDGFVAELGEHAALTARRRRESAIIARGHADIDAGRGIEDDDLEAWLDQLDRDESSIT
jgi:hypothetical protein